MQPQRNSSFTRRMLAVAEVSFSLAGCAGDDIALKPSEIIARAQELDGKQVSATGWIEVQGAICIWDSKEDYDHGRSDADTVLGKSLSIMSMPVSAARHIGNRSGRIEGTFYIDVARGRVSDAMCNTRGIEWGQ